MAQLNALLQLQRRLARCDRRTILAAAVAALFVVLYFTLNFGDRFSTAADLSSALSSPLVDLTLLRDAQKKGALCLDGSPAAYHLQRGFGSGANSWLLHLEGGGWCNSFSSCFARKFTPLGSSRYMKKQVAFVGILSNIQSENPDFYNWNKVKIRYCDGGSFSGNSQDGTELFFRGQLIWEAVLEELLQKGMTNAKQVFLTGCSAGGLATFIHCDDLHALLPKNVTVKCLADAGFFLDEKDISGNRFIRSFFNDVVRMQDLGKRFRSCMEPAQCFFPREIIKKVRTPLFVLNPAYDIWQIQHILAPEAADIPQSWLKCKLNIHNCDSTQLQTLQGFRSSLLTSLTEFKQNKNGGMFINSCFIHCQTTNNLTWHSSASPKINNKTIAEAVGDWYFKRSRVKRIDCPYPCNPTCINLDLSQPYKL